MSNSARFRNEEVMKLVGQRIREIRKEKGISQMQLAHECDLELSTINRVELGKINASISLIALIAERLGVSVKEFF